MRIAATQDGPDELPVLVRRDWDRLQSTPRSLLRNPDISSHAKALFGVLDSYADDGVAFPGVPTLAGHLGVSDRTVQRARGELVEAGYLTVEQGHRGNGGCSSNVYYLHLRPAPPVTQVSPAPGDTGVTSNRKSLLPLRRDEVTNCSGATPSESTPRQRPHSSVRHPPRESSFRRVQPDDYATGAVPGSRSAARPDTSLGADKPPRRHRPTSAAGLVERFQVGIREHPDGTPGPQREAAGPLGGSLRKWLDEGWSAETISAMIDYFLATVPWADSSIPPWRQFLAHKQECYEAVHKQETRYTGYVVVEEGTSS